MLAALGLGNPGKEYEGTRHNLGREVIELGAERLQLIFRPGKGEFIYAHDPQNDLLLAYPTVFVNLSGRSAIDLSHQFHLNPDQIIIVCDDFNLPLGRMRIRKKGSDGGHNGLASVIDMLGTEEIPRLRIGIGPLPMEVEASEFVLSRFEPEEAEIVEKVKVQSFQALIAIAKEGIEKAMTTFNHVEID